MDPTSIGDMALWGHQNSHVTYLTVTKQPHQLNIKSAHSIGRCLAIKVLLSKTTGL